MRITVEPEGQEPIVVVPGEKSAMILIFTHPEMQNLDQEQTRKLDRIVTEYLCELRAEATSQGIVSQGSSMRVQAHDDDGLTAYSEHD